MAQQQKAKKPNIFVRFGKFLAKAWSELKKVTWPTFPTVMKNLGIVLVVVLFFTREELAVYLHITQYYR